MTSIDVTFSRKLLSEVMKAVRKYYSKETIKSVWAYLYGGGSAEFHINVCPEVPSGFYTTINATNLYHAKAEGWSRFLELEGKR